MHRALLRSRLAAGVAAAAIVLAACGFDGLSSGPAADAVAGVPGGLVIVAVEQIEPGEREDVPSGLRTFNDPLAELPQPTTDLSRLRSGGPPPDGIPSIDDPVFYAAQTVDYISPNAPVLAVEIDGDARAYPLDVMVWHEIVNDTVGGVPVAVEYCPLCNSATVFDRRIEGRVLEFGVSGLLFNSSLVMYDRQTETLWSHFSGRPLYGELGEAELVDYPTTIVGFEEWRTANPNGIVLSRETGVDRNYGSNPYPGYDNVDADPFLFEGEVDGRFTAMTRMVGIAERTDESTSANASAGGAAAATSFPLLQLREAGVVTSTLGDQPVVAFWVPGSASALDASSVAGGVDVGATGVFVPEAAGMALTFASNGGVITDNESGSTWNIFGAATDGELVGEQLEQVVHIDTFWFAWIAFHPDSAVAN
jgi:hypothetical protein